MQYISYVKMAVKSIVILVAGALLGVLLLTVSFLLPANQKNLEEPRALIEKEAWYPKAPELSAGMFFETHEPGVLDNSSDCIMLYTAMDDSEGNPLLRAMDMYSDYAGRYSYYWHGYVTILRPLALLFNYSEIRVLNGALQILLISVLVHLLWKKKDAAYAILVLIAYFLLMPQALSVSLQYSWVFYIAFLGALLLISKFEYWIERYRYLYFFLVLGMLTSFFDLLTYPLFTWGFPILLFVLLGDRDQKALKWIGRIIASGVMWILGYGGLWYLKWILGTWILKRDILQQAIEEVFLRVGREDQVVWSSRWNAVVENWQHYEYVLYMLLILGALLWIAYHCIRRGWKYDTRYFSFGLIAVSPFVWYGVLTNHTTVHHLFTYRIFSISILAVLCAGLVGVQGQKQHGQESARRSGLYVWAGILLATVIQVLGTRQEEYVFNGECSGRQVLLPEGETMISEFHPAYREINRIQFYMMTESTEGYYQIELYQDDMILDQRRIFMDKVREQQSFSVDVDWILQPDSEYYLAITAQDGNAESYIFAANGGQELLPEYGYCFRIGEQTEDGQLIAGIYYRYQKLPEGITLVYRGITCCLLSVLLIYMIADIVWILWKRKEEKQNEVDEIQN